MANEKGKRSSVDSKKTSGGEKYGWLWPVIGALFSVVAIFFFSQMVSKSGPAKKLVCNEKMRPSLTSFGSCREE